MTVEVDQFPHRPLTLDELNAFRTEQAVECPVAFHSFCTHCETEGIVDALIRDGRTVYALRHGWAEWELTVFEEDMDPAMFRFMVEAMEQNTGIFGRSSPRDDTRTAPVLCVNRGAVARKTDRSHAVAAVPPSLWLLPRE